MSDRQFAELQSASLSIRLQVPTRTTKQGTIKGYSTILHSLARELTLPQLAHAIGDVDAAAETPLLVGQWLDYCALFAEPASRDKCAATVLLKVCAKSSAALKRVGGPEF